MTEKARRSWFIASTLLAVLCLGHVLYRARHDADWVPRAASLVGLAGLVVGVAIEMWWRRRRR
jgi:hypothetical protein